MKNLWRNYGLILFGYIILTIIFTYPIAFKINTPFAFPTGDFGLTLWNLWWVKKALLELHTTPFFTSEIFYPTGTTLSLQQFAWDKLLLGIPLQLIMGRIAVYNLLFLFSVVVSGFGTYLLVKHLTDHRPSAFISGIIYAFCPYHLLHYGVLDPLSIEWFPFFCLYLLKMFEGNRTKNAISGGIFLTLISLSSWYYMVFAFLFIIIFILYFLIFEREKILCLNFIKQSLFMIITFGILIFPFAYPILKGFITFKPLRQIPMQTSLYGFSFSPFLSVCWFVFYGYIVIVLAASSLFKMKRYIAIFWIVIIFVFFILSVGPHPVFLGKIYDNIPLPMLILHKLPVLSLMRAPWRYMVMIMLCLAVLSGYTCKYFSRGKYAIMVLTIISLLICLEYLIIPLPASKFTPSPIFAYLGKEKGDYAVLELPFKTMIHDGDNYVQGLNMYFQTIHQKKIIGGYINHPSPGVREFIYNTRFINIFTNPSEINTKITQIKQADCIKILKEYNIKYIIIHKEMFFNERFKPFSPKSRQEKFLRGLIPFALNPVIKLVLDSNTQSICQIFSKKEDMDNFLSSMHNLFKKPFYEDEKVIVYRTFNNYN
ncbi:MAG: hypothetical protein AB1422_11115 [bacterium]